MVDGLVLSQLSGHELAKSKGKGEGREEDRYYHRVDEHTVKRGDVMVREMY